MKSLMMCCALLGLCLGCGSDNKDGTNTEEGGSPSEMMESCFTDDECVDSQYCRASDPLISPEGVCSALETEGGSCLFGSQCTDGLACVKSDRSGMGMCSPFPAECEESPTCMCALELCAQLEGSSCSLGSLDNPTDSITVSCSPSS